MGAPDHRSLVALKLEIAVHLVTPRPGRDVDPIFGRILVSRTFREIRNPGSGRNETTWNRGDSVLLLLAELPADMIDDIAGLPGREKLLELRPRSQAGSGHFRGLKIKRHWDSAALRQRAGRTPGDIHAGQIRRERKIRRT